MTRLRLYRRSASSWTCARPVAAISITTAARPPSPCATCTASPGARGKTTTTNWARKSGGAPDACSVAITASGGGTVVMAAVPAASSAAAADAHHSALLPPAASSDQQQHLVYCRHLALSALEFIASAFPATPFDHLAQSNPLLVLAATLKIHMSPSAGGVAGYAHVLDAFTTVDGMLFVRFPPPRAALHWTDHAAFQDGVTGLIELAEEVLQCRQLVCCLPRGGGGDTKPPAGADQLLRAFMYVGFTPIDAATVVHDAARYQLLGYEL